MINDHICSTAWRWRALSGHLQDWLRGRTKGKEERAKETFSHTEVRNQPGNSILTVPAQEQETMQTTLRAKLKEKTKQGAEAKFL